MSQIDYIQWFEQLCHNLTKKPHETTRIIEEFRESENVLEISLSILQSNHSSNEAKFHALSCLQYALLLRWETLPPSDQQQWIQLFETFLFQAISLQFPTFVSNKLIQVFASLQKKRWTAATSEEKLSLYHWLMRFFQAEGNEVLLLVQLGVNIILSLLEEFMKKSNADLGIHNQLYLQRKIDFETNLLPHLFLLLVQQYHKYADQLLAFDPSASASPVPGVTVPSYQTLTEEGLIAVLHLVIKALIETISWEYGETQHKSPHYSGDVESERSTSSGGARTGALFVILKPPAHFHDFLIQSAFIEKQFHLYGKLRLLVDDLQHKQQRQQKMNANTHNNHSHNHNILQMTQLQSSQYSYQQRKDKLEQSILEIRNFILSLSLMNGDIFKSDGISTVPAAGNSSGGGGGNNTQPSQEKIMFGNTILSYAYQLAQPHLERNQLSLLTFDAFDYSEGFVRYEELLFFLQLIHHFFQNYTLQTCLQMQQFPLFLQFISSMGLVIGKELSLLTSDMTVKLIRSNYQDVTTTNTANENIFHTWRFDLLFQIFDILIMIHDDFVLTSTVSLAGLASPSSSSSSSTNPSVNAQQQQLQLIQQQTDQLVLHSSLKQYLFELSKELFPLTFEIIMVIFVNDSLSSAEEEEQEEEERILSRNLDTFFMGLSSLGRFSIFHSLQFIGNYLSTAFLDFQTVAKIYDGVASAGTLDQHSLEMKTLFCLEKIRLCILLISFLLIDNFSSGNTSGASSQENSGGGRGGSASLLLFKSSSGEVSTINDWILDAMKKDNLLTLQMIVECVRCVSIIYQFMMSLLSNQQQRRSQQAAGNNHHNNHDNNNDSLMNPCISPYLLQSILYFYSELFIQYLQPNIEDYAIETVQLYPFLETLFRDEKDIYNIIEMLLSSLPLIIDQLPLEMEVIQSLCLVFKSIAMNENNLPILHSLLSSNHFMNVLAVYSNLNLLNNHSNGSSSNSNNNNNNNPKILGQSLNFDGLSLITEMIGILFTKGNAQQLFAQLSQMLYLTFDTFTHFPEGNHPLYLQFVKRVLACLNGLARAPAGQDETLQKLFDSFFTSLATANPQNPSSSSSSSSSSKGNSFQQLLTQNDEVLTLFSKLIRDYAEYQLSRLYDTSAKLLYSTVAMVLFIYKKRLSMYESFSLTLLSEQQANNNNITNGGGGGGGVVRSNQEILYEENIDFINDSVFLLLEILNHLSTKEFLFSDYPITFSTQGIGGGLSSGGLGSSAASFAFSKNDLEDIPSVLIYGLQMLIPLIQIPVIYSYPETLEKYLSFIVFLLNSSMKSLIIWWNYQLTAEMSLQYFVLLMKQLLLSMSVPDGTTARMALQSVQLIIMNEIHVREHPINFQINATTIKDVEYLPLSSSNHHQVLISVLKEILHAVLISQSPTTSSSPRPESSALSDAHSAIASLQHYMRLDKKLLFDRIDAIGNVLMVFIVWNFGIFQEIVNEIIIRQVPSVKQLLVQYLQTLLTDRSLSLQSIQKKNRLIFVQNFRDFYLQIKNLTIR